MMRYQQELSEIVLRDPAVDHVGSFIGGSGNAPNNGRMFIALKPHEDRTDNAYQVIARLRPQLDKVEGARLFLQAAQDVRVGGRPSRTQFQYTLQGPDIRQLNEGGAQGAGKVQRH